MNFPCVMGFMVEDGRVLSERIAIDRHGVVAIVERRPWIANLWSGCAMFIFERSLILYFIL